MLAISLGIGIVMFFAEIYFIYSFQLFLSYIGLMEAGRLNAPQWLEISQGHAIYFFAALAIVRIMLLSAKTLLSTTINQSFIKLQRIGILTVGLMESTKSSSHEIVSMFSDRVARAGSVLADGSAFLMSSLTVFSIFCWGIIKAPKEMLVAILLTSLVVPALKILDRKIRNEGSTIDASWKSANKTLIEGIRHYFYLFYHGLIPQEIQKGKTELQNYETSYRRFYKYSVAKNTLPQLAGVVSLISVSIISRKYFSTDPAVLLSFLYLFTRMAQGLSEIVYLRGCLKLNMESFWDVYRFQQRISDLNLLIAKDKASRILNIQQVDFKNLSFSFEKDGRKLELFNDFNLSVVKGQPLVIKGPSGVGKSTLISILLGFNKNYQGKVSVNGQDISLILDDIRESISYVGPEPFLFEDTIYNNLTHGIKNTDREEIVSEARDLLKKMKLWSYVERQEHKFDSKIAEFADLSTGQKQRLSLVRALLRKPAILILDEATANIDRDTEKIIIDLLKERKNDMVMFIITHKDSFDEIDGQQLVLG